MDHIKKYISVYIGVIIIVALTASMAGNLLSNAAGLNTTFQTTGVGNLFGVTIFGIMIVGLVSYALYQVITGKLGEL
jgi:hypothetical protein